MVVFCELGWGGLLDPALSEEYELGAEILWLGGEFGSGPAARFGVSRMWMCRVLRVDQCRFYNWLHGHAAREHRRRADDDISAEIVRIPQASDGMYEELRVARELRWQGVVVNRKRTARVIQEGGIVGVTPRQYRSLIRRDRSATVVPDLTSAIRRRNSEFVN